MINSKTKINVFWKIFVYLRKTFVRKPLSENLRWKTFVGKPSKNLGKPLENLLRTLPAFELILPTHKLLCTTMLRHHYFWWSANCAILDRCATFFLHFVVKLLLLVLLLRPTSSQMSTFKLQHFFLNEFPAYFGKCWNLSYSISQNMLEIHSKKCCNLKVDIWLELDHRLVTDIEFLGTWNISKNEFRVPVPDLSLRSAK